MLSACLQLLDLVVDRRAVHVSLCGAGPGFEEVAFSRRRVFPPSGAGAMLRPADRALLMPLPNA
eukprot:3623785-Lingulodinium_polyedra.AAC.1